MPIIQVLSDLHLEAPKGYDVFEVTPSAPYLALIGDIGCVKDPGYLTFIKSQLPKFKTIFVILGNHEPYHSDWITARQTLNALEKEVQGQQGNPSHKALVFLDQTRHDISPEVSILGCTLHSKVLASQFDHVSFGLNDFYHIKDWTVEQHNEAHAADLAWLNKQVKSIAEAEPNRKIIILTHHSPSTLPETIDPAFTESKISSGFSTDLSAELCWTSSNVKVWAFGHTHYNCDFIDPGSGKRVVTNQRGYYFSQAAGFDSTKCIEL